MLKPSTLLPKNITKTMDNEMNGKQTDTPLSGNDGDMAIFFRLSISAHIAKLVMIQKLLVCLSFIALLLIYPQSANADVALSSLGAPASGDLQGFDQSAGFSIGFQVNNTPIQLTSVELELRANVAPGGLATLQLRSDVAGNPGLSTDPTTVNFTSQSVTNTNTFSVFSFTPTHVLQLAANTTYWLTIGTTMDAGVVPNNGLVLQRRGTPAGTLASFVGIRTGFYDLQSIPLPDSETPGFRINSASSFTAVPEPSSLALAAVASGLVGYRYRRRIARIAD